MLFPQLTAILSSLIVIGTSGVHYPALFKAVMDAQRAIEEGNVGSAKDASAILDAAISASSPQINVGDTVSLTSHGKVTFGFHALLQRYPLDMLLQTGTSDASLVTINPSAYQSLQGYDGSAVALKSTAVLPNFIRVNSTKGMVGLDQCSSFVTQSAMTSSTAEPGWFVERRFDQQAEATVKEVVPISGSSPARATSASMILLFNTTARNAPANAFPYFSSARAAGTYAPEVSADARDAAFNKGLRGFPRSSDAFFTLKYLNGDRRLTSEGMPMPLMMDEDPTDPTNLFAYGLYGARSASPSAPAMATASAGRSAVYLVPVPQEHRVHDFPSDDSQCIRFGNNKSAAVTNVGLEPTPIGGSVPIFYHKGCFVAVVAPVRDSATVADAVAGVMSQVVAQWISVNARSSGSAYTDSVMAARRVVDGSGSIVARDGSRIQFVQVRVGPSATSASYANIVAPMKDDVASYMPPMFLSWVGGVATAGTCVVPQFIDDSGARRISIKSYI